MNSSHEHLLQASIFLKVARSHKVKIPGASAKTSGRIFRIFVLMDGTPSTHRCKEENNAKATSLSTWRQVRWFSGHHGRWKIHKNPDSTFFTQHWWASSHSKSHFLCFLGKNKQKEGSIHCPCWRGESSSQWFKFSLPMLSILVYCSIWWIPFLTFPDSNLTPYNADHWAQYTAIGLVIQGKHLVQEC